MNKSGLESIGPCPAVIYSRLLQYTHTTTHSWFYREQLSPTPPNAVPVYK